MNNNKEKKMESACGNKEQSTEPQYSPGKHPNSLLNLKPWPQGVSGNIEGRPTKFEHLKRALNAVGDEETFNYKNESEGTKRKQVWECIWDKAIKGDLKYIQLLAGLDCLDEPK